MSCSCAATRGLLNIYTFHQTRKGTEPRSIERASRARQQITNCKHLIYCSRATRGNRSIDRAIALISSTGRSLSGSGKLLASAGGDGTARFSHRAKWAKQQYTAVHSRTQPGSPLLMYYNGHSPFNFVQMARQVYVAKVRNDNKRSVCTLLVRFEHSSSAQLIAPPHWRQLASANGLPNLPRMRIRNKAIAMVRLIGALFYRIGLIRFDSERCGAERLDRIRMAFCCIRALYMPLNIAHMSCGHWLSTRDGVRVAA